jgi:PAS domain S-box-containing protein
MTEKTPDFRPEPDLQLTEAHLAMQRQLMELTGVAQLVQLLPGEQVTLNSRACEILGLNAPVAMLTLQHADAMVHAEDLAQYRQAGDDARSVSRPVDLDYRVVRPDGRVVFLHARRSTERNAKGRAVANVILAIDVTERKRVETALLETAERFRALTAPATDAIREGIQAAETSVFGALEEPVTHPSPIAPLRKMRVLYVEDNMFNLMLFDEMMQTREDVVFRIAQDGAKGLDIARSWLPDVIVLDAHLPDIHGIELLHQMRELPELRNTPAFLCSGDVMPEHKQAALEAGFAGYWTKPVNIDKVFGDLDSVASRTVQG